MVRTVSPPLDALDTLRQPLEPGERIVRDWFLRRLPESWEIYIQPHLNGLRPDFVLLHPRNGIAVYEVKDWDFDAMEYFVSHGSGSVPRLMASRDGKTFSIEKHNPVTKIDLYKREIFNLYCPRLPSDNGLGVIVAGVLFPFAAQNTIETLLAPLRRRHRHDDNPRLYPIIGKETLGDPSDAAPRGVLPIVDKIDNRMSAEVAEDLRHWLVEPAASAEQRSIPKLDSRQRELVDSRTETGYRRVRGPAGSGKTFVLAGRAATLASEGKRVLVVTFNITLINWILDLAVRFAQNGKVRRQIEALNFHAWCRRIAAVTGHDDSYHQLWRGDSEHVLDAGLANAAERWAVDLDEDERWDAILVDEGQDFHPAWWSALRRALRPGGEALLCADRTQNIYGVKPWTEEQMAGAGFRGNWFTLEASFRLSPSLCRLTATFVETFVPDLEALPPQPRQEKFDFSVLEWRQVAPGNAAEACRAALLDMVCGSKPEIHFTDVTCIVQTEDVGRALVELLVRDKGIGVVHTFGHGDTPLAREQDSRRRKFSFFKGDARVKVTTLHSFKGWESRALVLHVGRARTQEDLALVYTAMTRLRHDDAGSYLTVICEAPELREFGATWPKFKELRAATTTPLANLLSS